MHHADAQTVRVVWILDLDLLPVFPDNALFRLVHAEQHAHQRGLSGAVFSQQRVDLAPLQLERDVVVCDNSRKALGDIQHFNGIWLFQLTALLLLYSVFIVLYLPEYFKEKIQEYEVCFVKFAQRQKEDGITPVLFLQDFDLYLMLPAKLTVMVVAGMAEMSLETVTPPSYIAFTRAL